MIVAAKGPFAATAGRVHSLYVSLNSPVVTVDDLPAGPASAAVALHDDGGVTLMIRSSRSKGVAFFHADPADGPGLGAAVAFSHAEGLGFLFDEEQPLGGIEERVGWPAWLAEIFPIEVEESPRAAGAVLSKFRWALPLEHAPLGRL